MATRHDVPEFGPLRGLKVAHASISIAGPFAAQMFADLGADVIWIENSKAPDIGRDRKTGLGPSIDQDRRNTRNIGLNVATPAGTEIFRRIIADVDIFIEASKPGQYDKWGWSDEEMWEVNPKLIIVHISGYGQTGHPDYQGRASYDPVAQAFGGMMYMQGSADMPSHPAMAMVADYYTGMMCAFAALASYHRSQATGQGESVDAAQYEIVARTLGHYGFLSWNYGMPYQKTLVQNGNTAGYNTFRCRDGQEVFMLLLGVGVMRAGVPLFGLEYGGADFPENCYRVEEGTPAGDKLIAAIETFCSEHDAQEVEDALSAAGVPCSMVMRPEDQPTNRQYIARETLISYRNMAGAETTAVAPMPRLRNEPGKVWRSGPFWGQDTVDIMTELGFNQAEIDDAIATKVVRTPGK